ncbi:MAG TPA: DUF3455 domain-containing protein [Anaeromyxobacteraceae bacterium]|nr:DUF3455 domain-containing protein [Anaeromyxobacteraceae bacterium]
MRKNVRIAAPVLSTLLATAVLAIAPSPARADGVTVPAVPPGLEVDGAVPFLEGHAVGTQNYVCLPSGTGFAWSLFTPEATLFWDGDEQLTTHFFGPNPDESGTIRAAWEHSRDSSTVWASLVKASSDAAFVAADAIPWLKLQVVGTRAGPGGGDKLTWTTFIQRIHTAGGVAPATGCAAASDVGARAFVPYTADYYFYAPYGR